MTVHDTWNSIGMRATASNDDEVTDAQIPDNWILDAFGPMRREDPLALVHAAAVAADVTRSMFDLMTTTAIEAGSVFALLVADASVAKTHIVHSHRNWAPLGARLSGHPVQGPTVFV